MSEFSPRRALLRLLGIGSESAAKSPVPEGYSAGRRALAGLLGVQLEGRSALTPIQYPEGPKDRVRRSGWWHRSRMPLALSAVHAADSRMVLYRDAQVTANLLQNLGPVLTALQPTKDAVIRAGSLLIVKIDWQVQVFQLTAAQQSLLDHQPQLTSSPNEIVRALDLPPAEQKLVVSVVGDVVEPTSE